MKTKICGIRSSEDLRAAVDAGAEACGFLVGLVYRTDDELHPDQAQQLVMELPPFVSSVLVTHRPEPAWVVETARTIRCSTIQLHGPMDRDAVREVRRLAPELKLIKAVHVEGPKARQTALDFEPLCDAVLLDTKTSTRLGGTGETHDWNISASIVRALRKPVILAGGLNPENVQAAIGQVRPFAVDVNSGVEADDGSKSPRRVRDFVARAHAAGDERTSREIYLAAQPK